MAKISNRLPPPVVFKKIKVSDGRPVKSPPPAHSQSVNAPNQSLSTAELPRTSGFAFYALLFLALAAAAGLFMIGYLPKVQRQQRSELETRELALIRVRVSKPVIAPNAVPLALPVELKPATEASIMARVTGYVRKWNANIGDQVKTGQVLAELDTPELQREIGRAEAQLALAEAAHKLSETTAKRWQELFAAKTASSQEIDEKMADLELKNAASNTARAELQRLQQIASFATITAPFSGTITARHIDLGQLVEAGGSKELFHLEETTRLRVFVRVPQSYARSVKVGQEANILLSELGGQTHKARVVRTAGAIDPGSRTLLVEMEADNADGALLSGSFAQIQLPGVESEHPLTVPANALIFRAEGALLAVVPPDGKVELKKISLGRDFGSSVEITEGVNAESRVIINPPDAIATGVQVEVVD